MQKQVNKNMGNSVKRVNNGTGEAPKGNLPEKKFRAGAISATVWLNQGQRPNGEVSEFRTITLDRRYMDKEGQWQSTTSLRVNDIPKARAVFQKAYEYIVLSDE